MSIILSLLPSIGTIAGIALALFAAHWFLQRRTLAATSSAFRNQLIMLALTGLGLLLVVLVLPIPESTRGQLLGLGGVLASAAIALSSTTFLGNAMAGIMLRALKHFRIGDFIECGDYFGRVSERGLFHTEIQTEERDLVTLPNLYLVTNAVRTVRTSGTIIYTLVSLGYDVPRSRAERLLLAAADQAGFSESFVSIKELGDYAVTYRVAGLLTEVKKLLSARSRLRGCVMDSLHEGGVEIVSPEFRNVRSLAADERFIPRREAAPAEPKSGSSPEEIAFDKAEEAESLESLRLTHAELGEQIKAIEARIKGLEESAGREDEERNLSILKSRRERLGKIIAGREADITKPD